MIFLLLIVFLPSLLAPLACGATVAVPVRSSVTAVPIASFHVYHPVGADERYGLACHTGELCAETLGNGDRAYYDYRYDPHDNPDALKDAAVLTDAQGRVEARVDYAYDLSGRVSAQTFAAVDGVRYALHDRYDAAGRLVEQTRDDLAPPAASTRLGFAYSADDDMRVKLTQGGHFSAESYRYDGLNRRVSSCDGGRCRIARYDARGDALTDEHDNRYRYDDLRRTVAAGETDDTVAYAYYPDGWRADKTRDGQSLVYHYAGDTPIDAEHGDQSARWLLADGVSARVTVTDGQTRVDYPFAGRLGSVLGETDMAGAWRGSRAYRPFGRQIDKAAGTKIAKPDPLDLNRPQFGFQGEPQDPETGNTYHETRYNRGDGLWTTHDELDTINAYAAFNDDPGNEPDPDGRLPEGDALSWAQTALDVASYLPGAAGTAASLGSYALSAAQMPGGSDDGEGGLEGGDEGGGHSMPWWGGVGIGVGALIIVGLIVWGVCWCRQPRNNPMNDPLMSKTPEAYGSTKMDFEWMRFTEHEENIGKKLYEKRIEMAKSKITDSHLKHYSGMSKTDARKTLEELIEDTKNHIYVAYEHAALGEEPTENPIISLPDADEFKHLDLSDEYRQETEYIIEEISGYYGKIPIKENLRGEAVKISPPNLLFLIEVVKHLKKKGKDILFCNKPASVYRKYKKLPTADRKFW